MTQVQLGGATTNNYVRPSTPAQFRAAVTDPHYAARPVWAMKFGNYTCDASKKIQHLYLNAYAGALNLTLPASPDKDDTVVLVQVANTWVDYNAVTVKQNGQKIQGLSEDMTLASKVRRVEFTFFDAAYGWIVTNT
jgi:hypothetical protein